MILKKTEPGSISITTMVTLCSGDEGMLTSLLILAACLDSIRDAGSCPLRVSLGLRSFHLQSRLIMLVPSSLDVWLSGHVLDAFHSGDIIVVDYPFDPHGPFLPHSFH